MDGAFNMDNLNYQMSDVSLFAIKKQEKAFNKDVNAPVNQAAEDVFCYKLGYF